MGVCLTAGAEGGDGLEHVGEGDEGGGVGGSEGDDDDFQLSIIVEKCCKQLEPGD